MDPRARSAYRALAWGFLGVAAAVVLVQIGERAVGFEFFNGNPFPVALFLGAIGGLLLWTARAANERPDAGGAGTAERPPFELRDLGGAPPSGGAVDGVPPDARERRSADEERPD